MKALPEVYKIVAYSVILSCLTWFISFMIINSRETKPLRRYQDKRNTITQVTQRREGQSFTHAPNIIEVEESGSKKYSNRNEETTLHIPDSFSQHDIRLKGQPNPDIELARGNILSNQQEWTKERAEEVITTYLHYTKKGYSQKNITETIFKKKFANGQFLHCYPFVCPKVFRAYANMVLDNGTINGRVQHPRQLKDGDVIWMNSPWAAHFAVNILPMINTTFVLITHDSDNTLPRFEKDLMTLLDSNLLLKWFALNTNSQFYRHPKVAPLPYGFRSGASFRQAMERVIMRGLPEPHYQRNKTAPDGRPYLVYINYSERMNRSTFTKAFKSLSEIVTTRLDELTYFTHLSKSKYVLSPRGWAIDCYRHYQSIMMRSIPIVEDLSPFLTNSVFKESPVYLLPRNWQEKVPNREDLLNFVPNEGKGRSVVLAQYWLDKIEAARFDNRWRDAHIPNPIKDQHEWNKDRADDIINTYIHYRRLNVTRKDITRYIFRIRHANEEFSSNCYPFLCPTVFKTFADYIIGADGLLNNKTIEEMEDGDVFFVQPQGVHFFSRELLPRINKKFIFITAHADPPFPRNDDICQPILTNPYLHKWFAINANPDYVEDPKVAFLPMGFRNLNDFIYSLEDALMTNVPARYDPTQDVDASRPNLLYVNTQSPDLKHMNLEAFKDYATLKQGVEILEDLKEITRSKFALAPTAHSRDCQKLYEALVLGAIPVIETSSPMLLKQVLQEAPVFVLPPDWRENGITESDLLAFKANEGLGRSVILGQYWLDKVEAAKSEILNA